MDTLRYVVAVLFVISVPPAIGWWFIVHPFVGFWRRVGTKGTFLFISVVFLATAAGLYLVRDALLGTDYGTQWGLVAAGVPLLVTSFVIQTHRKKHLTWKILAGAPEIAPDADGPDGQPTGLLCEGVYAHVRHPRYVEFVVGSIGWTLILNYLGVYLMMVAAIVAILVVVPLEERELRDRFGEAYALYSRRVPRFIPRRRRSG